MTMHVYRLTTLQLPLTRPLGTIWEETILTVRNRDWYAARAGAFKLAIEAGHTCIGIIVDTVTLYRREAWNGLGTPADLRPANAAQHHGLWLYLDRLCKTVGHVYVPPIGWVLQGRHYCRPVPPLIAAYRTSALRTLTRLDQPVGKILCGNGYQSVTVSDYFYRNQGETVLDEPGSASTWGNAYERAVASFVGA